MTLYIAKDFFRDLLFGIDFMNDTRATLKFPSNKLMIDRKHIATKVGKVRQEAHSICYLYVSETYRLPERAEQSVQLDIIINKEGDQKIRDGDLVRLQPLQSSEGTTEDVMVPHCITKVEGRKINVPLLNKHDTEVTLPIDLCLMRVERFNPDILSVEEVLPRPYLQKNQKIAAELRAELLRRLEDCAKKCDKLLVIPGINLDDADLTPEQKRIFILALGAAAEYSLSRTEIWGVQIA